MKRTRTIEEFYRESCRLGVQMSGSIESSMEAAGMTRKDLAAAARLMPAEVEQILDGEQEMTVYMFARLGLACGVRWSFVGTKHDDIGKVVVRWGVTEAMEGGR